MKRLLSNLYVVLGCRILLAALFLVAAPAKLLDPKAFAIAIDNYHFLPRMLVNLWAVGLPWVEVVVGVILLTGPNFAQPFDRLTEAAAFLSALMYLSFVIALGSALVRGLDINCGCFAPQGTDVINWTYLVRDSALLIASLVVFFFHRTLGDGTPA